MRPEKELNLFFFKETSEIIATTKIGEMTYIQTEKGLFKALEIIIEQNDNIKKW